MDDYAPIMERRGPSVGWKALTEIEPWLCGKCSTKQAQVLERSDMASYEHSDSKGGKGLWKITPRDSTVTPQTASRMCD